jgi:branched-subunit amino acid aminotransferase/4-amino-4-deoxychorismate lyase
MRKHDAASADLAMTLPAEFHSWIWSEGEFVPATSLPLSDRGFRYGMSVFESLRVTRGVPEFFEQHLSRLLQACAERELAVDEAALTAGAGLFAAGQRSGFARLYVTAGDGGPAGPAEKPRVYALLESRTPPGPDDAWEITLHDESYHPPFGGLKTANYWFNADAFAHARRRRFDETLLFNDRAELVSASMANVFLLRDDRLYTPSRSTGARPGVIREWVMKRRKVIERRLRREDIVNADEIFLTNSWIGVMPVATVEGRPLGHRSVGPKLAAELERRREET